MFNWKNVALRFVYVLLFLTQLTCSSSLAKFSLWPQNFHRSPAERQQLIERLDINYLAQSRGFHLESHRVLTRDHYVLTLHRLVNPLAKSEANRAAKVVILQHGILSSSSFWLMNSALDDRPQQPTRSKLKRLDSNYIERDNYNGHDRISNSLAIALVNSNHDVWLTNLRGNQYSREHADNSTIGGNYWNFNVDTLIEYDLEAYVNYVLKLTNAKQYTYIGHSLGATMELGALLVHKGTSITNQLSCSVLMAPVASTQYMSGHLLPMFQLVALLYNDSSPFPSSDVENFATMIRSMCLFSRQACTWAANLIIGAKQAANDKMSRRQSGSSSSSTGSPWDRMLRFLLRESNDQSAEEEVLNKEEYQRELNSFVLIMQQSISVQVLKHIMQVRASGRLSRYNYGPEENMRKYGYYLAPIYDLTQIHAPKLKLAIINGPSDAISTPGEVEWIAEQIKHNVGHYEHIQVSVNPFNHMDLVMSRDAGMLVNKQVIEFIERNEC